MKAHKNKIIVLLLLILPAAIMSFTEPAQDKQPQKFQNLKVLPKNIAHDNLIAIMKNYCAALNVKCGFCHVKNGEKFDFAADDKDEKKIARKMQTMANAINKKYFGGNTGTVACMTCHNGKENPTEALKALNKTDSLQQPARKD